MDTFWILAGASLFYFVIFGLNEVVKTYMTHKVKIAQAQRDAKHYELETARITSDK